MVKVDSDCFLVDQESSSWSVVVLPDYNLMFTADLVSTERAVFDRCKQLCERVTHGIGLQWRLPELHELQLILDYTKSRPAADSDLFKFERGLVWTNTKARWCERTVWQVELYSGRIDYGRINDSETGFAIAVSTYR